MLLFFFFFNDTATTEIYTLSLHDALPIWLRGIAVAQTRQGGRVGAGRLRHGAGERGAARSDAGCEVVGDRKSTRLNSSHVRISYAVFCLKKKNTSSRHLLYYRSQQDNHQQ